MNKHLLWIAGLALSLVLVGQLAFYHAQRPTTAGHAAWIFQPATFQEVVAQAPTIIEAEVVSVAAGPDLVNPAPGEPTGEDRTPTTYSTMKVLKVLKGALKPGEQVIIFRTGVQPENAPPPPTDPKMTYHPPLVLEDDPPYHVGEQHFLLLNPGPDTTLQPVSPEGRYQINADHTVVGVSGSTVSQSVTAHTVQDLERAVTGATPILNRPETGPATDPSDAPAPQK